MDSKDRVQWIYSSKDSRELTDRYDLWAKDYDEDLEGTFGWLGPRYAADYFARYVPTSGYLLDAGAGTGLTGVVLYEMGYRFMVAADLSPGMLEEARRKDVYTDVKVITLGEILDFPTDSFDGVISTGVFTVAHVPAAAFDELVRITKPGGHIVYTLRPDHFLDAGFREKQTALEDAGKWVLVEASEPYQCLPKGEPDIRHQVWVYRVV
jgi:SAM-dependent methyltransferase